MRCSIASCENSAAISTATDIEMPNTVRIARNGQRTMWRRIITVLCDIRTGMLAWPRRR